MRLTRKDHLIANRFFHHPDIYPMISDDFADPTNRFAGTYFLQQDSVYMLRPAEHVVFLLTPRSTIIYEVHTLIEPEGRGAEAVEHAKTAAAYMFSETDCEKIITYVPFYNRPAKIFAMKAGMVVEGICTKSIRKYGELHDQWVLALEKEKFLCQQSSQ